MPEKSCPPLKNPPLEKSATVIAKSNNSNERVRKGLKGKERETNHPICGLVECPSCGEMQNIVFTQGKMPPYHKCVRCGELMPVEAYRLSAWGWPPMISATDLRLAQERKSR